jgi:hypothetical protein
MPGPPGMGGPGAEQGAEAQMPGAPPPGGPPQPLAASGMPPPVDRVFPQSPTVGPSGRSGAMPEPPSISKNRPRPGKLSRGGQGPRKDLEGDNRVAKIYRKSFAAELDQELSNGHN